MDQCHRRNGLTGAETAGLALLVLLGGAAVTLVAPGLVLVFAATRLLGLALDPGQSWAFGVVVSACCYGALRLVADRGRAHAWYLATCAAAVAVPTFCALGFHSTWPTSLVRSLLG
jgi:hypothetical protein